MTFNFPRKKLENYGTIFNNIQKDYIPKEYHKRHWVDRTEFRYPIRESFRNYLQLSSSKEPIEKPTENADVYFEKQNDARPKIAKLHFKTPINNGMMEKHFIYNGRTVYQIYYCDLERDKAYKEEQIRKNMFRLPDAWDVPLTTQKYCYRDPIVINSRCYQPLIQTRTPNNLGADEKIREILKVTTGKTDYGGVIGELGDFIVTTQLHGKVKHE